jgi:hypothetical protein
MQERKVWLMTGLEQYSHYGEWGKQRWFLCLTVIKATRNERFVLVHKLKN